MSSVDVMKFKDWISSNRRVDSNWTVVAQSKIQTKENLELEFFSISVLAETNSSQHLITDSGWLTMVDFGHTKIWEDASNKLQYEQNVKEKFEDILVEPFVIYRMWDSRTEDHKFEIVQDFILFYNLFFDEKESTYNAITDTGEIIDVVKISHARDDEEIKINTRFLRNYLAVKNKILVVQHEHTTNNTEKWDKIGDMIVKERIKKDNGNFELLLDRDPFMGDKQYSRLRGKDMVLPFNEQKHLLGWSTEYCKFIIYVNDQGNEKKVSCQENNNSGANTLTPVFFKREVLKKYYSAPSKYNVTSENLFCGNFWYIPIDTNAKDLIQVWLVDLGRIPYGEQQHWKLYNVPPEGGVTKYRIQKDIYSKFIPPESIVPQFKISLSQFQEKFEKKFGFIPFMQLHPDDQFIERTFRIPLDNEVHEFESQITYLAKMLQESIDIASIKQKMNSDGVNSDKIKKIGTKKILALESLLEFYNMNTEIIYNLHKIQHIRSRGIAHRKGGKYEKTVKKYELDKITRIEFIKKLTKDLTKSFDNLCLDL